MTIQPIANLPQNRIGFNPALFVFLMFLLTACSGSSDSTPPTPTPQPPPQPQTGTVEPDEELSGGATTVFETGLQAFGLSARNLSFDERTDFLVGNSFFEQNWVIAPASTTARDGLGPLFNARSCSSCHFRDGRGRPPESADEDFLSMLIRLSVPGETQHGGPVPVPNYGGQLNARSIPGVPGEGREAVTYEELPGEFADGMPYSLRKPTYTIQNPAYGDLPADLMISPRTAPSMIGLGLLETIAEGDILALADEDDEDGDGVSGRPNWVWSAVRQRTELGRFGWKANQPDIEQQSAGALLGDLGVTTAIFPDENCASGQDDCAAAPNGGQPEMEADHLADLVFYSRTLAVPARRNWEDPTVLRGKFLFTDAGCASCHTPAFTTAAREDIPALSDQKIRPYTDLLLHDMGPGLADGRPDFRADGSEWRTPPLWGIGLQETVNNHIYLLHDGRARGFAEAVLWHGGEAENAKERFRTMDADDRDALIAFLESL